MAGEMKSRWQKRSGGRPLAALAKIFGKTRHCRQWSGLAMMMAGGVPAWKTNCLSELHIARRQEECT
jgi:hypothetical protein